MINHDTEPSQSMVRIVRYSEVRRKLGISEAKLFNMIAKGEFPRPFAITPSGRAKGWIEATVDNWIEGRESTQTQEGPK